MTVGILTEKPSAARAMAAALSGQKGSFEGTDYVIAHARGHLYELAQPEAQIGNAPGDELAALKSWDWKLTPIKGASAIIKDIRSAFAGVEEIVIATDVDPSGEGGSIAVNVLKEVGLDKKPISRMYFTDEAPASLQKAFKGRKQIPNLDQFDEYLMSRFRSAWDFASMQFTRVATASAAQKAVYRNGRLKSAIVLLVGDQRKAHDSYVKVTRFQNRFRDENGILYTDPDEATYSAEADVPRTFNASKVVLDSRQNKRTAPRALLDLAALSSRLSGKGITAAQVLAT
ncbi:MAG: toprim domain-containing protein, partial [Brevibacterium aurantiacum]|nr:toprim domain-containing protein [Brevibacterium aurantiacum]